MNKFLSAKNIFWTWPYPMSKRNFVGFDVKFIYIKSLYYEHDFPGPWMLIRVPSVIALIYYNIIIIT